jgi:glycolate oxidase iron-sulfur subunit
MHVELHPKFAGTDEGKEARALTSACVHCGFCLETCPTYLDTRDERDSPRGRIYLIKQLLESGSATDATREHLDRCLTCRNCETTCPSGMEYGQLLDIGRGLMEVEAPRSVAQRLVRRALRAVFVRPALLGIGVRLGQWLRPLLPSSLAASVPPRQTPGDTPPADKPRTMLILEGCVQQAVTPATNAAARRVLDALGISLVAAPRAGCCGALDYHLGAHEAGLNAMRRNIDAWWPWVEDGVEAIISSASGCGAMLEDYGRLLAHDAQYADKARRITELSCDLGEAVAAQDLTPLKRAPGQARVAIHTPCTLTHALGAGHHVEHILNSLGIGLTDTTPDTRCCGSAGTYSLLQRARSERIREVALQSLCAEQPDIIATANVGCQLHLQAAAPCTVAHWIELIDPARPTGPAS